MEIFCIRLQFPQKSKKCYFYGKKRNSVVWSHPCILLQIAKISDSRSSHLSVWALYFDWFSCNGTCFEKDGNTIILMMLTQPTMERGKLNHLTISSLRRCLPNDGWRWERGLGQKMTDDAVGVEGLPYGSFTHGLKTSKIDRYHSFIS